MDTRKKSTGTRANAARACAALALVLFSSHILNSTLFPPIAEIFPTAREISTYGGVAFSIAVAIIAWRKPSLMNESAWSVTAFALSIASSALLSWATISGNVPAIVAGSPLSGIASIWLAVLLGSAFANFDARTSLFAITGAFLCEYALRIGLLAMGVEIPVTIASALYIAALATSYALIRTLARNTLRTIHDSVSPSTLNITSPQSYVPLSSFMYFAILFFSLACGFAVSGETQSMEPISVLVSFLPITCAFACIVARGTLSTDSLYKAAALLVFAGFLTAPFTLLGDHIGQQANAALLNAGSDMFALLLYYLVATAGFRNRLGAASMAASAFATQWVGIGIGAPIAQAVGRTSVVNPAAAAWATTTIAFAFVAFNFIGLGKFSFSQAIQSIMPAHIDSADAEEGISNFVNSDANAEAESTTGTKGEMPRIDGMASSPEGTRNSAQPNQRPDPAQSAKTKMPEPDDAFAQACAANAARFGLTARETEVFELLARGRTSPFIQEKLVLSRNTVKTHVRHIYAKLGIHSQQELISIVENAKN